MYQAYFQDVLVGTLFPEVTSANLSINSFEEGNIMEGTIVKFDAQMLKYTKLLNEYNVDLVKNTTKFKCYAWLLNSPETYLILFCSKFVLFFIIIVITQHSGTDKVAPGGDITAKM